MGWEVAAAAAAAVGSGVEVDVVVVVVAAAAVEAESDGGRVEELAGAGEGEGCWVGERREAAAVTEAEGLADEDLIGAADEDDGARPLVASAASEPDAGKAAGEAGEVCEALGGCVSWSRRAGSILVLLVLLVLRFTA